MQFRQSVGAQATDLEIGAPRQVDMTVAEARGDIGKACSLGQRECTAPRLDAHQQTVAAFHRTQRTGAPALHFEGGYGVHDPARWIARSSS